MAIGMKQMSMIIATLGVLSFIFGVIAENKKPAAGTAISGKGVVICKYKSDPTVALGYLSFVFLAASSVAGFLSLFYPYQGKSVPQAALLRNTSFVVFLNIALFLNRAALKCEGDVKQDDSIAKPWRLCTVSEVEDFKSLMRTLPLCSSSIFLSTPIAVLISLSVLQALAMDRHLGPHFQIPAGSIPVIVLVTTSIFLTIFDRFLFPAWEKLIGHNVTPFKRIGVGHVLTFIGLGVAALVESKRLNQVRDRDGFKISVLWLVPHLVLIGIGEAFHFPGQVSLYYQEFPTSLKSVSTALTWLVIAVSFYVSTALIDLVRRTTSWLPNDINQGRIDKFYWVFGMVGMVNFGYYLLCVWFYKRKVGNKVVDHGAANAFNK